MEYNVENVKDYLNFKINNIVDVEATPWNYPVITVKSLQLKFPKYYDLSHFLYCLKRESDFGLKKEKTQETKNIVKLENLLDTIAFDSNMNIISNRSLSEEKLFKQDILEYHKLIQGFWGQYIDSNTLNIHTRKKSEDCIYSLERKSEDDKIVIIQPTDSVYDETYPVYISTDIRPNKSLQVAYVFQKCKDELVYLEANKNDWIF